MRDVGPHRSEALVGAKVTLSVSSCVKPLLFSLLQHLILVTPLNTFDVDDNHELDTAKFLLNNVYVQTNFVA